MDISVIIPTYKPQSYFWECLESVLQQTFSKDRFEVLILLNGCKEPYWSAIQSFVASHADATIVLEYLETKGVSNARNVGLQRSKGRYITFIDDDDFISPTYLEELFAKAATDTIAVCYPYAFNDGDRRQMTDYYMTRQYNKQANRGKQRFEVAWKFFSGPCMKLIPHEVIDDRRFDVHYANGEDGLFLFSIADKFRYIAFTSVNAIYYRRYRQGSALTRKRTRWEKITNELSLMRDYSAIYFRHLGKMSFRFYALRIAYKAYCVAKMAVCG